ncbi:spore germination protein [Paenibacillus sp. FJAT-26967]|uniref:spore germination protein n=1 Tax=Paenibacillus sp. FJAT-26967 TaxID=1729690 RepID=UPI000A3EE9F2|nr:spore germination protein [Paenibacillus sp. FJAT-26967]
MKKLMGQMMDKKRGNKQSAETRQPEALQIDEEGNLFTASDKMVESSESSDDSRTDFGIKTILQDNIKVTASAQDEQDGQDDTSGPGTVSVSGKEQTASNQEESGVPADQRQNAARAPEDAPEDANQGQEPQNSKKTGQKNDPIPFKMEAIKAELEKRAGLGTSFDLVLREMVFDTIRTGFFYVNGFAKDDVLTLVLDRLSTVHDEAMRAAPANALIEYLIPHIQVEPYETMEEVIGQVLAGGTAVFIEGEKQAIVIDAKQFPSRSTEEPDLERVVRGSRDGFVETLMTNVALVRRRIRDPQLRLEITQVGKRTSTDICIAYINDIANNDLVQSLRDKIKQVEIDGIPLAEKQLEEAIMNSNWNPYPKVRYTERPDVASAHLLEGHAIVMADTSPSVMIMPTTFFHHVQHAEEYRQLPIIGSYLRWVRFMGMLASIFLLPLWYLLVLEPSLKPAGLEFIGPQELGQIPILIQFLLAELGIDLMRMASVHTPTPLSVAMGLVAAILIGDIAVKTGLFTNEIIFYISIATIGMFATPSYELSLANRIVRLLLLFAVAIFKVPGFVGLCTLWMIFLCAQRSYNAPYMWPFIPFNGKGLLNIVFRLPVLKHKTRLSITRAKDVTRQPPDKSPA